MRLNLYGFYVLQLCRETAIPDPGQVSTGLLSPVLHSLCKNSDMIRVLGCIFQQHDLRLVVVAAGLCMLACATALSMISRARAANGRARMTWLAGAGTVAGCGIWGTHFVAML